MSIYHTRTFNRGFGTFPLQGESLTKAIMVAIEAGYRAFDTAQMYQNEAETGAALKSCGLDHDEFLVTTKVHPNHYTAAAFIPSVEQSLRDLQRDCIDVLLLHWPPENGDIDEPLDLLAEAKERGLTKHIGVSNFNARMMCRTLERLSIPIACNQVEFHPLLDQSVLLKASTQTGIPLTSYSSVARGEVFQYPLFDDIGATYGKTAAQVVLRWILQKGVALNTMSTKPQNIAANFDIDDFALSTEDMQKIDVLNAHDYRIVTADLVPWAPEWD